MFLDHAHIVLTRRAYASNLDVCTIYIYIYIHIYISQKNYGVQITSVGLAQAHPNYNGQRYFKVVGKSLVEVNENINVGYSQDQGYS